MKKTCYILYIRTVRIYRIIAQSENPRFAQENPRMVRIRTLCITIYLHIQYLLAGGVQHAADCILLRLIESCVLQLVKTLRHGLRVSEPLTTGPVCSVCVCVVCVCVCVVCVVCVCVCYTM